MKSIDFQTRPIRHRNEDRVWTYLFICLLAHNLQWHLRQALKPLLYQEEEPLPRLNLVAPKQPSKALQRKKPSKKQRWIYNQNWFEINTHSTLSIDRNLLQAQP